MYVHRRVVNDCDIITERYLQVFLMIMHMHPEAILHTHILIYVT